MYPPLEPYRRFHLPVGKLGNDLIEIYVLVSGNPKGIPVIYLHGGPGDHAEPGIRQLFHPKRYHIVQFDQRGCGHSRPPNHLRKNTTPLLLHDIEAIRQALGIDKFVVAGGSWGTTLALLYAGKYPTLGLLLRGVYDLSTQPDMVLGAMYPDLDDKIKRFTRGRSSAQMLRSTLRNKYLAISNDPHPMYVTTPPHYDSIATQLTLTLIGNHYADHHYFTTKKTLYKNIKNITSPVYIVQGRYDFITPPIMAYNICQHLTHCHLQFSKGGHTYHDFIQAFIQATNSLANKINPLM